ncbi:DUF3822 family protein [Maribacter sp. 2308TA10-17]|uniref:DUF3822 family protein n=1 Tax=Maribacter sp. 2308TA10-17 TaxID=3386276 RepID=UPI0039BCF3C6
MTEKVSNNEITDISTEFNKLSIQVSLNGLSFCILDTVGHTVISSDRIVFEKERTPYGLQKGLVALFKKHKIEQQRFSEIIVVHRNKLFSLVPKSLFDENEMPNYLKFNTKILANDHLAYDEVENHDMITVYVPFVNVNNYIYELFGEFTYKHSGTVMVESLLTGQNIPKDPTCYVHVADRQMEVTVISQKKLLLYNSFDFITKEDFIYYLLFTLEQLELDTETTKLKLFGAIEEEDAIYKICYEYVKDISIMVPSISSYPMDLEKDAIDFTVLKTL